ncbi:TPA: hypothetical protein I7759_21025 [Vibrio vulnificus]|uniref:GIY-YIG domain-containing protein n=3 Tax=Vibrio TaxID=662 RepID=A0ABX4WWE8_VIBVL|nr:hypothetical protein [Vibrio vulnificus]EHH1247036.1 hypothetical protein [Vibrio parahaemolyticus]EGQ9939877.1 hypothetical protein [Vibrio vulnificus]EGR0054954.1 hypothetical protein [Vibrio vulnificus]EHR1277991.1 hypothetical protein [Vibrio parahaemolyticus]EID4343372.1 hypothetical protein [Vibrio vulnificus]
MKLETLQEHLITTNNYLEMYSETLEFGKPSYYNKFLTRKKVNVPGIYKIEIRLSSFTKNKLNWKKDFEEYWDIHKGQGKRTPSSKKGRLKQHDNEANNEWIPLYIGRSLKVKERLELHRDTPFEKPYQALKLQDRGIFVSKNFRVSFLELPKENYEIISHYVEDYFREKINPIVGNKG